MTLGDYLRKARKDAGEALEKIGKKLGRSRAWVSRLETGKVRVEPSDLTKLAGAYHVDELILASFVPRSVETQAFLPQEAGFRDIVFADEKGERAEYRIPLERLRGSRNFLVYLTLGPGGVSRDTDHRHPGDEIVYCSQGEIEVHIGGWSRKIKQGDLVHFDSRQDHQLSNPSREACKMLIVRQYEL